MTKHDIIKEIREIKTQLAYVKSIGTFFGAGTSCALNVPNIAILTKKVEDALDAAQKNSYEIIKKDLTNLTCQPTIEGILNRIRQIRAITDESDAKKYLEINGDEAKQLDINICKKIYEIISESEEKADRTAMKKFIAWLSMQNRDFAKEIFTPNYDLIIERSLEDNEISYFDGFVGGYEPFFFSGKR